MPDQFGLGLDELGINFEELIAPRRQRRRGMGRLLDAPDFPPLTPIEEKAALDSILSKGSSALQYVGETLDKVGRASRGVIGGSIDALQGKDPNWGGGLLNLIPFSDTMGLTDPKQQVEGRDILTKLGAPENKQGFHPIDDTLDALLDVGGFATEVLTDPLSYVSPLAWTKTGKAALSAERAAVTEAAKTGKLLPEIARGIGPRIAKGERSLARIGLPEWEWLGDLKGFGADIGAGNETIANLVGKTIDPAWNYLRQTKPVAMASKLFEPRAGGASNAELQQLYREKGMNLVDDMVADATKPFFKDYDELNRAGLIQNPEFIHRMRDAAEGLPSSWKGESTLSPEKIAIAEAYGKKTMERFRDAVQMAESRGIHLHELEDAFVQYAARTHHVDGKSGVMSNLMNNVRHAKAFVHKQRQQIFKDIEGGTNAINEIVGGVMKGPNGMSIWDMPKEDAVEWLAPKFAVRPDPVVAGLEGAEVALKGAADEAADRAGQLWSYVNNLDRDAYDVARAAEAGKDAKKIFNGDVLSDGTLASSRNMKGVVAAELLHEAVGTVGQHFPAGTDKPADWVWETQALSDWGLDLTEATRKRVPKKQGGGSTLDTSQPYRGGQKRAAMYLNRAGKPIDPYILAGADDTPRVLKTLANGERKSVQVANSVAGMNRIAIPPDLYQDGMALKNLITAPDEVKAIGAVFDGLQQIWKTSVTSIFPSFHARNVMGGLGYHWMSGAAKNPLGYMKPFTEAMSVLRGGDVSPETLKVLGINNISELVAEARANKVIKSGGGTIAETMTGPELARTAMQGHVPSKPTSPRDMITGGVADTAKRGAESFAERTAESGKFMKGVVAADEIAGGVVGIGRKVGDFSEDTLRLGHYIAQRAKGLTSAEAASSVRKYYFDFSELTPFEKQVMRRAFPFYTWFRKNTPLVIGELLSNPGGKLAQSIRAVNEPRDRDGYIPEWVAQGGAAIPTGKKDRFITSLGLPFESAFNWNVNPTIGKTISRNVETTIGAMTKPVSFAYTVASGRDPHSGRNIQDMYPHPTRNPLVNAAIANSPLSRISNTIRKADDDRKTWGDWNLDFWTGVKVTDVSGGLEAAKEQEGRKALEELMRAQPEVKQYTKLYADPTIPKEAVPATVAEYLRLSATLDRNRKAAAKKKQQQALTEQQELLVTPR